MSRILELIGLHVLTNRETITEELIGLHVLTNREAIMEELDALSDEQFANGLSSFATLVGCRDATWLHEACTVDRFLPKEVKA